MSLNVLALSLIVFALILIVVSLMVLPWNEGQYTIYWQDKRSQWSFRSIGGVSLGVGLGSRARSPSITRESEPDSPVTLLEGM